MIGGTEVIGCVGDLSRVTAPMLDCQTHQLSALASERSESHGVDNSITLRPVRSS